MLCFSAGGELKKSKEKITPKTDPVSIKTCSKIKVTYSVVESTGQCTNDPYVDSSREKIICWE